MTTKQEAFKELSGELTEKYKDVDWGELSETKFVHKREQVFSDMRAGSKKIDMVDDIREELDKRTAAAEAKAKAKAKASA